jgi:8-oxo-dGTP diphosphatase
VKKQINVVGAVIVMDGRVLCAQRGPAGSLAGLWEFPGGKIEPGETAAAALEREITEELECNISVGDEVTTTRHEYEFGIVTLTTFYCELVDGTPNLTEHAEVRWLAPDLLGTLDWAPADVPAVNRIVSDFSHAG